MAFVHGLLLCLVPLCPRWICHHPRHAHQNTTGRKHRCAALPDGTHQVWTSTICLFPTPIKSLRRSLPGKLRLAPHAPSPVHMHTFCLLPLPLLLILQALIGPPQAECHQTQHYHMYKGPHLVLETSQMMPNIPFGDHFTVEARWDVKAVEGCPSQCHVTTHVSVPFSKSTWWKKASCNVLMQSCGASVFCQIIALSKSWIRMPLYVHTVTSNLLSNMCGSV